MRLDAVARAVWRRLGRDGDPIQSTVGDRGLASLATRRPPGVPVPKAGFRQMPSEGHERGLATARKEFGFRLVRTKPDKPIPDQKWTCDAKLDASCERGRAH